MKIREREFVTPSVCECGFPALKEDTPLGRVYEVDEDSIRSGFDLICGGCDQLHRNISVINAKDSNGRFMPLPLAIFEAAHAVN